MKKLITILAAVAVSTSFALAADAEKKAEKKAANPEENFKKLDTNNDGAVSLEEFKAGPAGKRDATKAEAAFKRRDKDGDGKLTLEEFTPAGKKADAGTAAPAAPAAPAAKPASGAAVGEKPGVGGDKQPQQQ